MMSRDVKNGRSGHQDILLTDQSILVCSTPVGVGGTGGSYTPDFVTGLDSMKMPRIYVPVTASGATVVQSLRDW